MLTTKSWDRIMDAAEGGDLDALKATGSAADKAETMANAKEWSDDIQAVLRKLPRELLLILKTNECLRAVDMALGAPVNNLAVTARVTQAALAAKRAASRPGLLTSMANQWDWAALELRLRAFGWYMAAAHMFGWPGSGTRRAKQAAVSAAAAAQAPAGVQLA